MLPTVDGTKWINGSDFRNYMLTTTEVIKQNTDLPTSLRVSQLVAYRLPMGGI